MEGIPIPTPSTRLSLLKPTTSDPFSTQDIANNWQTIDDSPGTYICTSTTRPSGTSVPPWGAAQQGREIVETDTNLKWRWDGTDFQRAAASGLLKTTTGGWAQASRTTTMTTTSLTFVLVVAISNVVVPDGHRPLMIVATWPRATNTSGLASLGILRSNVSGQAPILGSWYVSGDDTSPVAGAGGSGASYVAYEPAGLDPGTYNWSLQARRTGSLSVLSTTTVLADVTTAANITIIEL